MLRRRLPEQLLCLAIFIAIVSFLPAHARAGQRESEAPAKTITGETMGTTYSVKLVGKLDAGRQERLAGEIQSLLDEINQRMSTYIPDSELMQLNRAQPGQWLPVSNELMEVLEEAFKWSGKTKGAFDVTVGQLVNLWGFGAAPSRFDIPPTGLLEAALKETGYQNVELRASPPALRKRQAGILLDLSAIAKGYAVDQVAQLLVEQGWERFLVELGGELKGLGNNSRNQPWAVAIESPDGKTGENVITLDGQAVATSGDYRQFRIQEGRRISHLLDPRTGWPLEHDLAAVTVIDESAMTADALATALIVLGPGSGWTFAEEHSIAALFVERQGERMVERSTVQFERHLARKTRKNLHD